ncbi:MAG TPA: hypothetical protein PLN54_05225 [Flavobacteriales bacterium]|nr:hypothetical protein [Flavobacteriales bacterium]
METITLKAFRAVDEPGLCAEFLRQHRKVLEDFGITNVTTNNEAWTQDPETYVIVAISDIEGMVGGIRIEVDHVGRELPIKSALFSLDHRIDRELSQLRTGGNAEICGLWNANSYSSKGLPTLLAFAAVSLANQIGIRTLVCLVAHYTLRHALKAGFTIMEGVGDGGTFTYPIPSIKAIAMVIPDAITLSSAPLAHRQQLLSLRLRPSQERVDILNGKPVKLKYELWLAGKVIDLGAYREVLNLRASFAETA